MLAPGMSWRSEVRPVVAEVMRASGVPGVLVAVARGGGPVERLAVGTDGAGRPLTEDSLAPVASITKLATSLAVLRLAADGGLALDDPLARHLPDAAAAAGGACVRALLRHTSGLPEEPGVPYAPGLDWPALARGCLAAEPVEPEGTRVRYSNAGMGLLAVLVERLTGRAFPAALTDLVLGPLGIEAYLGVEPPRPPAAIAGDFGAHAGTDMEPFNSAFWRSLAMPWGGLLTTAPGALALVRTFAGEPAGFLPPSLLAEATSDQTGGLGGGMVGFLTWPRCPWGLGAELRGDKEPHWAPGRASAASFGHAGSSGCVAWADPDAGLAWAILGTRTIHGWLGGLAAIGGALLGP